MEISYGTPDDIPILSSVKELENFQHTPIWQDMEAFLQERLEGINNELIEASDPQHLGRLQGEAKSIRTLLKLPTFLKEQKEIEDEQELTHNDNGSE